MSYILDALRKADAERERDPARGIHAQPAAVLSQSAAPGVAMRWWWLAGGLGVLAALAALAMRPSPPQAPASSAPFLAAAPAAPVAPPPSVAVSPPAPMVMPMPTATIAVAPGAPPRVTVPAIGANPARTVEASTGTRAGPGAPTVVAPVAAAAAGGAATSSAPAPAARPQGPASPMVASAALTAAPAAQAIPSPAAVSDRIPSLAELPDLQRELPKLAISGGVHSEVASQRMLIVGGQVLGEGSEVAPGVVLEQIRPKSAVLRFRGQRFSVGY